MAIPMTADQAAAVWDLLHEHAGAARSVRSDFIDYQVAGSTDEFRFQGSHATERLRSVEGWYVHLASCAATGDEANTLLAVSAAARACCRRGNPW